MSDTETAATSVDESTPVKSGKISGADMGIMTIVIAIAIICAAFYTTNILMSGPEKPAAPSTDFGQSEVVYWEDYTPLPEGIAAIVNGVEIPEGDVTDYVAIYRTAYGYEDNEDWALWVSQTYGDADSVRDFMVQYYVAQEVLRQAAESLGITVTDQEIQVVLKTQLENAESEEAFWTSVEAAGNTRENYLAAIEASILNAKIAEKLEEIDYAKPVTDEDVLAYIKASYPAYASITSLDEISSNISDSVRQALENDALNNSVNVFLQDFVDSSVIEVNSMPEGLPYDVDTGKQQLMVLLGTMMQQMQMAQAENDSSATAMSDANESSK